MNPPPLAHTLAAFVADTRALPEAVRAHAVLTLQNALGCAVGGSRHEAVATAARALLPLSGGAAATLIGQGERADAPLAALLNGMAAAVYSFDDTHAQAVVHPGGPIACALLALAETRPVRGADFLHAYAVGIEVVCRLSMAVSVAPAVNEPGWVQTGITAGVGVAAAVARVLGLDAARTASAMGIAATQAGGMRAQSRSMCFSLMSGNAAQAGLRGGLLASQGFSAGDDWLESPNGFLRLYSGGPHAGFLADGLGERFELLRNTFKPYPCGVVIHPAIDASLQLAERGADARRAESILVTLHPDAMRLGNLPAPRSVQEGQTSVQHWVAAALADGSAGLAQGRADKLEEAGIVALRGRVRLREDATLARDAAVVELVLAGGEVLGARIDHCRGSAARPMTASDVADKFRGLCADVLGARATEELLALCADVARLDDIATLARAAAGPARS